MKNKKFPLISVVMLNYNGLKYLKQTIKPILNQTYPNFEFIIVDNGSTDGSIKYIKKQKKIKLIISPKLREKNFACNYAIKRAKGEYIFLLDNDLLVKNNFLLINLINFSKKFSSFGCISLAFMDKGVEKSKYYGGYFDFYFIKELKSRSKHELKKMNKAIIPYPHGASLFITKKIWEEVGGYDSYLKFGGDDNDLGIRLWLKGYKNYLYSETLQLHLGLPERQDNKKYSLKWREMVYAHLYTILKNYKLLNTIIVLNSFCIFAFLKSVKQSLFRLHYGPFFAYFQGIYLFLKNLPHTLKMRKRIQSKRVIKEDIFLKIKPPKFD